MRKSKEVWELESQFKELEFRSATATDEEKPAIMLDLDRVSRALTIARENDREIYTGKVLEPDKTVSAAQPPPKDFSTTL
jgi:hypothetical protein